MKGDSSGGCPRCGAARRPGEALCARCLLDAAREDSGQPEDRLFQRALALEPAARRKFIIDAADGDEGLRGAVLMLLEGYEQSGGDSAAPTLTGAANNRAQWIVTEEPGMAINHFRLVRHLGEGGMGSVWRAEQTAPVRRSVALKLLKLGLDTREVIQRFERERQTLALLNHPNIARVFEAGDTAWGRPYFAMELVEGQPITGFCRGKDLGLKERLQLFRDVCVAVEHAHQKGVIHRDLKPSNILVTADGVVKVIDFGLAKATQWTGDLFLTQQARVLGTPAYMSPEQAQSGGMDVDTRTDVYALGVLLYELLTGTLPIESARLANTPLSQMLRLIQEEDPPAPGARIKSLAKKAEASSRPTLPYVSRDLDRVVMKSLRKDRNERYASAAALSEDLRRCIAHEAVSAAPLTVSYQFGKFLRRHRLAVAAVAAVLTALIVALIVSVAAVRRTNQALAGEARARQEVTFTLSDMHTRSGLIAAENGDATRAALWFANAAALAVGDSNRTAASRLRATAWRGDALTAVRAFGTGFEHLHALLWNPDPHLPALIAQAENNFETQIWDLETEQQWPPAAALGNFVHGAAWAPSGARAAISLTNGSIVVLEYPSGKSLTLLPQVNAAGLAWSPDERWIAGGAALWDWRTRQPTPLPGYAASIQFSRDGSRLLLQWADKASVCALADPSRFLFSPVPAHFGDRSEFVGDGSSFVVGQPSGGLAVYDSATGAQLCAETNRSKISDYVGVPVAVSPDGRFAARYYDTALDLKTLRPAAFPPEDELVVGASFSPDSSLLASGGYDDQLRLWSLPDGKPMGVAGHHHTTVVNVEFSPDGRFVASGEDGLARVWRVRGEEFVKHIHTPAATRAVLSPDGKHIAGAGFGNKNIAVKQTQLFEIASGQPAGPVIVPGGLLMDAVFSPDGRQLVLAVSTTPDRSNDALKNSPGSGNIQFWNPLTGERMGEPVPMPSEPRGLCFHPTGATLGVCCSGGQGVEVDPAHRAAHVLFDDHRPTDADATLNNGRCGYSADGRIFVTWGLLDFIHVWDREQGRDLMPSFERDTTTFDVALHDNIVARAIVAPSMRIEFFNTRSNAAAAAPIPHINWPLLTRFSGDGNLLLTGGNGKIAQVWDWRRGQLVCPALPHDDTIMAGCFLPGTSWVVTGGQDGKIKFWDCRTGMLIRPPLQFNGWVLDLQTTPDGQTLIADGLLDGDIELISLRDALPEPNLSIEAARLLSEIDADAEVYPGGGLAPLTPQAWLKKWREFRALCPDFAGHRLDSF